MTNWTPVAKTCARLQRVEVEEPGSMQHFATALHLSDVITKLHTLVVLGVVEHSEQRGATRLSFDLSRASSAGAWVAALRDAVDRVRPFMVNDDAKSQEWLSAMATWLTQKKRRTDEAALVQVLAPTTELAELLKREAGETTMADRARTPLDLMLAMVEIRNKTTGHHAYGSEFWPKHVPTVVAAIDWLRRESPLWVLSLALPIERGGKRQLRILDGAEPGKSVAVDLPDSFPSSPLCLLETTPMVSLGDLILVDPATNLTYLANGTWRDSDSSAEFLCHSLEAAEPGGGCKRVELPAFSIRPPTLPASETQGAERLLTEPGVVMNNLPPEVVGYVPRGALEEKMRRYLLDSKRRHLINVRGSGGFGKTSLVLRLCHELAADDARCPYDAIVWMSARDIDLTLSGAVSVRRAEESLDDVWTRYASLFSEPDPSAAREFFETSLRGDAVLVVLDNFETFDDQEAAYAYAYLDDLVEPPAKVIITSRHVFAGDSPVEVRGMSESEAEGLLIQAARDAAVEPLMTPRVRSKIFARCQGQPYAMKLVASQMKSEAGLTGLLTQVLSNEDLLEALFRRSLDDLGANDDALFVFLLVGQFAGGVSEPVLRVAVSSETIDLDDAVGALRQRSLLDVAASNGSAVMTCRRWHESSPGATWPATCSGLKLRRRSPSRGDGPS